MHYFQSLTAAIFEKQHCLNTTVLKGSLSPLCFDHPILATAQITTIKFCKMDEDTNVSIHSIIQKHCNMTTIDSYECIKNINNETTSKYTWLLLSLADPTGELESIKIYSMIGKNMTVYRVFLPRLRWAGKSVKMCYPYSI